MEKKKKLTLPLLILIIGLIIGLVVAGIGLYKQNDSKKINEERHDAAYEIAIENKERLEKRYAEINEELVPLEEQYNVKNQECNSLSMTDSEWYTKYTQCKSEASQIYSQISDLETEKYEIENYNNTVYYDKVKPMSYQIFYIIGGSIAGAAVLGAFIIYLVKGKKNYN